MEGIYKTIEAIEGIIPILLGVGYLTLAERKIMGRMQRRRGPNIVGIYGIMQPLADGIKLIIKELIIPQRAQKIIYIIGPIITLGLSIIIWGVIPWKIGALIKDEELGILYIFAILSISIYGIMYSGYGSQSKYSIIGGLRGTAQVISYEVSLGIIIMSIIALNGSLNITEIYMSQVIAINSIALLPLIMLIIITGLAETNRTPFDLVEAESELVAGYMVEYGGMIFAAFFIGEYSFILVWSSIISLIMLGSLPGSISTIFISFIYIWVRATVPRYRYDQLMVIGWTKVLPLSLAYLIFTLSLLSSWDLFL